MKQETQLASIQAHLGNGSINIFGMPFAGKDTHGVELAKLLGGSFVSGGSVLRSHAREHVKQHIAAGNLAPTDKFLETVLPFLAKKELAGKPLLLSSVGRWHGEEPSVIQATEEAGHPLKAVIYLDISEAEAEKRWHTAERGREDDAEHHILLNRFKEFKEKTLPVVDYYRQAGLLIEVDAMPPQPIVTKNILFGLEKHLSRA